MIEIQSVNPYCIYTDILTGDIVIYKDEYYLVINRKWNLDNKKEIWLIMINIASGQVIRNVPYDDVKKFKGEITLSQI